MWALIRYKGSSIVNRGAPRGAPIGSRRAARRRVPRGGVARGGGVRARARLIDKGTQKNDKE